MLKSDFERRSVYRQTSLRELPDACEALKVAGRVHFQLASHPSLDRITGLALAGLNLLHEVSVEPGRLLNMTHLLMLDPSSPWPQLVSSSHLCQPI